jgi:branched-chain amino acid transport system substrate-binding protein
MTPSAPGRGLGWTGGLALAVVIAVATAEAQTCPNGTLRIYTSWTLSGEMAPEGAGMKNGVALAVAEAGGVAAGYCLDVVNLDDVSPRTGKWDEAVEAGNATRAVADPQAVVYIGPYNSGAAKVSMRITNRAAMAQISPGATYPGLTKRVGGRLGEPWTYRPLALVNFFRPVAADDVQGAAGARWAKRLGAQKVFVLHDAELYGRGIADVFEANGKRIGLEIVANRGIDWTLPDQRPVLTRIRDSGADLVFMGGIVETGAHRIIRQMREVALIAPRVRFMGPDGLLQDALLRGATCDAALATDLRVTIAGLPFDKMTGAGARTHADYTKRFGVEPTAFALYAVEAGRVAIDGIRRAAPDLAGARGLADKRDAVRRAIAATRNFDGINGAWSFDRNGDVDHSTVSGFKVVRAPGPLGCQFQFDTIVQ